jgi:hypothetical protein
MAKTPDPTAVGMCQEALRMAGFNESQVSTKLSRAKTIWLPSILKDIWSRAERTGNTRLKSLQITKVAVSVENQRVYGLPSDIDEELTVCILSGDHTGTAAGGSTNTVQLAAAEDAAAADVEGNYILMLSGNSALQYREAIDYDEGTQIATMHATWDSGSEAQAGDTYLVVNQQLWLSEINSKELDELNPPTVVSRPTRFSKYNDQIYFNNPFPAGPFGIMLRYFANVQFIDTTEGATTDITRIYRNWQTSIELGLEYLARKDAQDSTWKEIYNVYEEAVGNLIRKEIPYGGEMAQLIVG